MNYEEMAWLPEFKQDQFDAALRYKGDDFSELTALLQYRMSETQLAKLGFLLAKSTSWQKIKIAFLSDFTVDFIVDPLVATLARFGVAAEVTERVYQQILQSSLNPSPELLAADYIVLAFDERVFIAPEAYGKQLNKTAVRELEYDLSKKVASVVSNLQQNTSAVIIIQTLADCIDTGLGSSELTLDANFRCAINAVNRKLLSLGNQQILILDYPNLISKVGSSRWFDEKYWDLGRVPFSFKCIPIYCDWISRIIAANRGKASKCLVVDLDNTLWGGVVGDDGVDSLQLSYGDPVGEAHLRLQNVILSLKNRGIIIAVCSKNESHLAKLPFEEISGMPLRITDFSSFFANWNDKATNIRAIASELNIGLDSIAFLDDNPAERELVRRFLPQVRVIEVDDDPTYFARNLIDSGYFQIGSITNEDLNKADQYRANSERSKLLDLHVDIDSYLADLEMVLSVERLSEASIDRAHQLVMKTNQFNLNSIRYSIADLKNMIASAECLCFKVDVSDKFGSSGFVCLLIGSVTHDSISIDCWVMSCRVFGRKIENAVFDVLKACAIKMKKDKIVCKYVATAKNKIVCDFLASLGFERGAECFALQVESESFEEYPFTIVNSYIL